MGPAQLESFDDDGAIGGDIDAGAVTFIARKNLEYDRHF